MVVQVNLRMPAQLRERMEEVARQRRMKTGEQITTSSLIREVIADYVKSEEAAND